ncbi:MAG: hypothetical protein ACT4PK_00185 [Gammaproteobacteria bacterium]
MSKRLLIVGGAIVVVVGIAAAVVLGRLGRLIETAVETQGPRLTGTEVALGSASVSVFSGQGRLSDLSIGNPQGYSDGEAFDLGKIEIVIDPKSLGSDVVRIKSVVVDGPRLLAEFNPAGRNNLKAILDHVKGVARGAGGGTTTADKSGGGETRMIIDEFRFENAQARALAPAFDLDKTVEIPPIVLKNLGAKQGGAAAADIANQVMRPVVDATVKAATQEYVKAQRGKLEDKAKDQLKGLLK